MSWIVNTRAHLALQWLLQAIINLAQITNYKHKSHKASREGDRQIRVPGNPGWLGAKYCQPGNTCSRML